MLEATVDAWMATASPEGRAHLVPLTFDWDGRRVVVATGESTATIANLAASGQARLAFGGLRDVVMMDVELDRIAPIGEIGLIEHYVAHRQYDPRTWGEGYVFAVLRPLRVQAWREADEIDDRTLMRDGTWLV